MGNKWISRSSAEFPSNGVGKPPASGKPAGSPLPPSANKSLSDIAKEREMSPPPPIPAPTVAPAPVEPMSVTELSQLVENSFKALIDARLPLSKASAALSKVGAIKGPSARDKNLSEKADSYSMQIKKIEENIESLAEEIKAYRDSILKPSDSWLSN